MKGASKVILSLLGLVLLLGSVYYFGSEETPSNAFRVGTSPDFPPFEYKKEEVLMGFDVELAKALAQVMEVSVFFEETEFASLVPALQAGRLDAIISGASPSPERAQHVSYSKPYYKARLAFVHLKATDGSKLMAEEGRLLGAQLGSNMEAYLQYRQKEGALFELKSLADNMVLIQDLLVNRLHGVLLEQAPAEAFVKANNKKLAMTILPEDPWQDERMDYVVVLQKHSPWVERVNSALDTLAANGTLEALIHQFLDNNE